MRVSAALSTVLCRIAYMVMFVHSGSPVPSPVAIWHQPSFARNKKSLSMGRRMVRSQGDEL
jgi:hypothetical protein